MAATKPVQRPQGLAHAGALFAAAEHDERPQELSRRPKSSGITRRGEQTPKFSPLRVGSIGDTDRSAASRLRRGRVPIDMRLDLHGLTLELGYHRLLKFITMARGAGARCVLVITGKGARPDGGIGRLRAAVPRWLNEPAFRPLILSAAHALPRHGGEGALYILIRKLRSNAS